ncbi:MAG: hypothetical protein ACREO1_06745 [Arenimonas sp.]
MKSSPAVAVKPVESNKPAATTTSSQPIPFRKDSVTNTPEVFGLLVTTILLVSVFAALTWYARRRGWLDRWVGPKPQVASQNKKIVVLETQRISQKTTLYRISNGDSEFLLAESSMQIQFAKQYPNSEPNHD